MIARPIIFFFFSSRRRHTRCSRDWSSDVCSSNLGQGVDFNNLNPNRPYSLEYSLHLQHQLKTWLFEVGYSHNKTYGIYEGRVQDYYPFPLWQQLRAPLLDRKSVV